jgi:predicted nucleic acid-binding protein
MIVLDSSAAVDYLLGFEHLGAWVRERLEAEQWDVHAPHLIDIEVLGVLRGFVIRGELEASKGGQLAEALGQLRIRRHPHVLLLGRMWELRQNVGAHDSAFVALANALGAPLVTTDLRLARAPGLHAHVLAPE